MRLRGPVGLLTLLTLLSSLAPLAAAQPTIEVVGSPDVVVANPPGNMTRENFNPEYVFTATARVTNDRAKRQVNAEAIMYTDPEVTGCPQDEQAFPVAFVVKNRQMEAGEQITIGGAAHPSQSQGDAYWPMALSQEYRSAATNETIEVEPGEHTFCTTIRVSGDDPACDKARDQTCIVATDSFRAYVRRSNAPPEISTFTIGDATPQPGQQVLFEAEATDADTEPSPDTLRYTWNLAGTEKTGKVVRHTFDVTTQHRVTLTVTDGFDEVTRSTTINVTASGEPGDGQGQDAPAAGGLLVLAPLGLAALLVARRQG